MPLLLWNPPLPMLLPHTCGECRTGRRAHRARTGTHARAGSANTAGMSEVWLILPHKEHLRLRRCPQGSTGKHSLYPVLARFPTIWVVTDTTLT